MSLTSTISWVDCVCDTYGSLSELTFVNEFKNLLLCYKRPNVTSRPPVRQSHASSSTRTHPRNATSEPAIYFYARKGPLALTDQGRDPLRYALRVLGSTHCKLHMELETSPMQVWVRQRPHIVRAEVPCGRSSTAHFRLLPVLWCFIAFERYLLHQMWFGTVTCESLGAHMLREDPQSTSH